MRTSICWIILCGGVAAPGTALADNKMDLACTGWSLLSAAVQGEWTKYRLKANCVLTENQDGMSDGNWDLRHTEWAELTVDSRYSSKSHQAVEEIGYKVTGIASNTDAWGGNSDHVSKSFPASKVPPSTASQSATCTHDPFAYSQQPQTHCSGHARPGWSGTHPFRGAPGGTHVPALPLTVGGQTPPYFFAWGHIDPQAANVLKAQAHNEEVLAQEQSVTSPVVNAPKAMQRFYSQDVTIQGLIPAKYKLDGQNCCLIELQKSNGAGGWLPPLPIGGKANIDTKGWIVAFNDFAPIGFGFYRVRISPHKYNPMDANVWSPYVEFGVWPKEILEVPQLLQPSSGQSYPAVVPVAVKINEISKQAKVHCCELHFQVNRNGSWQDAKTLTDDRLGKDDNAVQYDPNAILPGGGKLRVRVRFHKSLDGEALNWSGWREFAMGPPQSQAPPGPPKHLVAPAGAAPVQPAMPAMQPAAAIPAGSDCTKTGARGCK